MKLIDADKFFMKVYNASYPIIHGNNDRENGLTMYGIAQLLDEQQTIAAVPVVHGHWEKVDTRGYLSPGGTPTVRCSNCKDRRTEHLSGVEYPEWRNFCPVCGALMDEVTKS